MICRVLRSQQAVNQVDFTNWNPLPLCQWDSMAVVISLWEIGVQLAAEWESLKHTHFTANFRLPVIICFMECSVAPAQQLLIYQSYGVIKHRVDGQYFSAADKNIQRKVRLPRVCESLPGLLILISFVVL